MASKADLLEVTRPKLGYLNLATFGDLRGSTFKIDEKLSRVIERDSTRSG